MTQPTLGDLQELLYGWPHTGMVRAGTADPFSGFLLVGARIDALASLIYESEPGDQKQGKRYSRFVGAFPKRYPELGLGKIMWKDLRSGPLHFLSSSGKLALAANQPEKDLHLRAEGDLRYLHWPEFLHDYETARDRLWERIQEDPHIRSHALVALQERPQLRVQTFKAARLAQPSTVASAYSGQSALTTSVRSESVSVTGVYKNENGDGRDIPPGSGHN